MPDVRLIDANALLKELRKIEVLSLDGKDLFTGPARIAVFGRIEEAPTITPPVRTGRRIEDGSGEEHEWIDFALIRPAGGRGGTNR